jgi:hypothetical protein
MRAWPMMGLGLVLATGTLPGPAAREDSMDVRLSVRTDRSAYAPEDSMAVELILTNPGTDTTVLRFATGQRYDVEIHDTAGVVLWRWSEGRMFMQMLGQLAVPPGETVSFRVPARAPAQPGRYVLAGRIPVRGSPVLEAQVEILVE